MYMFETFLKSIPKNRSEFVNDLEIPEVSVSPYVWTDLEDTLTTRSDSIASVVTLNVTEEVEEKSLNTASSVPLTGAMTDSDIDYNRYKRFKHRRYSDPWDLMKAANDTFPSSYLDTYRHGRYRYYDGYWSKYRSDSYIPWSTYYRYGLLPSYKYDVPLPKYSGSYKYEPLTTYRYSYGYEVPRNSYYRYGLPSYDYSWRYSYLKPWRYNFSYYNPWRYNYDSYLYPWRYSFQTTSDYVDEVLKESRLHRYEYNEKLRQRMKKYFDEDCNVFSSDDPGLTRLEEALLDLDYKTLYPYYYDI